MAKTFCQRLIETANVRLDHRAMVLLGPNGAETTTFCAMLAQIRSLAFRLAREGIAFGDRVAIIGENHPHWAMSYLGIVYRGAIAVPMDPAATVETLAAFLEDSETRLAFVSPSSLEKFVAVCNRLGHRIPAVALHPADPAHGVDQFEDWARTPTIAEFDFAPPPARAEDMAVLMYTSGTTGAPKGVPLTHGNILAESEAVEEALRVTDREVILSLLPLYHAYSQMVNLWVAVIIGARVVYITEISGAEIERGLKAGGATILIGVPRLFYLFHKRIFDAVRAMPAPVRWLTGGMMCLNGWLRDVLGLNAGRVLFRRIHRAFGGELRLTISGGSSLDPDVASDFHQLGFNTLQGYGLTETSGAAAVTRLKDNEIGSVGMPLKNVEIKIDGPNGEGIGEILIRGPIVASGYYHNSAATREAFLADGWFCSGDLGCIDRKGHLYITGRKKDVIVLPSGKKVYPEDVEPHYERSPLISEICLLGVRDETSALVGAEKLCGIVVPDFEYLKANRIANAREAIRFELDNRGRELPEHQRVRDYILRTDPLPRTGTRKIRRFELRAQIEDGGASSLRTRDAHAPDLSVEDRAAMDSPAGRAVAAAIRQQAADAGIIHPQLNLELDLGLDSLARAECMASIENMLGIKLEPEAVVIVHKVGELVALAEGKTAGRHLEQPPARLSNGVAGEGALGETQAARPDWRAILDQASMHAPELQPILKRKRITAIVVYALLRLVYAAARVFLGLEVRGLEVVKDLRRPFLVCPNHQSYIDPILVCASYPVRVLEHIFHVGASEYFTNPFSARLARLMNIVPIDPDTNLVRAMRASAAGLRAGKILNIYPEGQRSFDGVLHRFKKGGAILAIELDVPIVPVALDGTHRVWPRGSSRIRLAKVRIRFGEPIHPKGAAIKGSSGESEYDALTAILKDRIQRMLDEMRRSRI